MKFKLKKLDLLRQKQKIKIPHGLRQLLGIQYFSFGVFQCSQKQGSKEYKLKPL